MSNREGSVNTDTTDFIREVILKELDYRREKQWRVFSWTSTLLTAVVGGVVALKTRAPQPFLLPYQYKLALSLSVVALTWYACSWIDHNWKRQGEVVATLEANCKAKDQNISEGTNVEFIKAEDKFITYNKAIILLVIAAGVVIWV